MYVVRARAAREAAAKRRRERPETEAAAAGLQHTLFCSIAFAKTIFSYHEGTPVGEFLRSLPRAKSQLVLLQRKTYLRNLCESSAFLPLRRRGDLPALPGDPGPERQVDGGGGARDGNQDGGGAPRRRIVGARPHKLKRAKRRE